MSDFQILMFLMGFISGAMGVRLFSLTRQKRELLREIERLRALKDPSVIRFETPPANGQPINVWYRWNDEKGANELMEAKIPDD